MEPIRVFSSASVEILETFPLRSQTTRPLFHRRVPGALYSSSRSSDEGTAYFDFPEDLNSVEFLEFSGFSATAARKVFQYWEGLVRGGGVGSSSLLIDAALDYIKSRGKSRDAWSADHDWFAALTEMGMFPTMCDRILDPRFSRVRLTRCACSWAMDTILMAYEFLSALDGRIREKAGKRKNKDWSGGPGVLVPNMDQNETPFQGSPSLAVHLSASSSSQGTPTATIATMPPAQLDNRTVLYKGSSFTRLNRIFGEGGSIQFAQDRIRSADRFPSLGILSILQQTEGDRRDVRRVCTHRRPEDDAAVLHAAVPSAMISNPREIFGTLWRELVWNSRHYGNRRRNCR